MTSLEGGLLERSAGVTAACSGHGQRGLLRPWGPSEMLRHALAHKAAAVAIANAAAARSGDPVTAAAVAAFVKDADGYCIYTKPRLLANVGERLEPHGYGNTDAGHPAPGGRSLSARERPRRKTYSKVAHLRSLDAHPAAGRRTRSNASEDLEAGLDQVPSRSRGREHE